MLAKKLRKIIGEDRKIRSESAKSRGLGISDKGNHTRGVVVGHKGSLRGKKVHEFFDRSESHLLFGYRIVQILA
jgi:hypothetical protein